MKNKVRSLKLGGGLIAVLVCTLVMSLTFSGFAQEVVTLHLACDGGANIAPFEWMEDEIETENPIDLVFHPLPFEEVYSKLKAEFVGQTGAYDIVVFWPKLLGDFVVNRYLLPLDEFNQKLGVHMDDVLLPFREFYCKSEGKLYALPYDGDILCMFYRKDLFNHPEERKAFKQEYGYDLRPPKTWDEWLNVGEFFTRKKGEKLAGKTLEHDFYGLATYGQRDFLYCWWLNRYASAGGSYFDEDMKPLINTPEAVAALQNHIDSLKFAPPEVLTYGFDELQAAFIEDRVAMEINWTDVGRVGSDPRVSKVVGKIGTALVPGTKLPDGTVCHRPIMAAGRIMGITKTCKHPKLAFEVIRMMALDASLAYVSSSYSGMDPFRYSHFDTPGAFGMFANYEEAKAYLDGVKANHEVGYPELTLAGCPQYMDSLTLAISQALLGTKSAKGALDRVVVEWNKITQKMGPEIQKKYYRSLIKLWKQFGY